MLWSDARFLASEGQQARDFFVRDLVEVEVPLANRHQELRCLKNRELISLLAHECVCLAGGNGRGDHDGRSPGLVRSAHGRKHRGTGRKAIVDQNGRLAVEVERRQPGTIELLTPLDFGALLPGERIEVNSAFGEIVREVRLVDHDVPGSHRADRELRLSGHSHFAHDHHIERCMQGPGHFVCNRYATPGKAENEDGWLQAAPGNGPAELDAGFLAIGIRSVEHSHIAPTPAPRRLTRVSSRMHVSALVISPESFCMFPYC